MPSNKPFMGEYILVKLLFHGNELDRLQVSFKMLGNESEAHTHQTLIVYSATLHLADGYAMQSITFRF